MKDTYRFLAFDLGAESGRGVLGTLANGKMEMQEIHRFRTEGLVMLGTRQWDLARIYEEMTTALRTCARDFTPDLDGIAIDTWGVDFGLLDKNGDVLGNPVHYRDKRNDGMMEKAAEIVPREDIYKSTGIQFMPFNTIYQLLAMVQAESPLLEVADTLLMMPDLLGYLLSGQKACEYSIASTSQLLDPHTRKWHEGLIAKLGLPRNLLIDPVAPGTVLGTILPDVAAATGINPNVPIIAPGCHDTASAVVASPVTTGDTPWAYLSSGTWSLLGVELNEPLINADTASEDVTNEGGVCDTIRFLKNIVGLWLVQECRRTWEREGTSLDYAAITKEAAESPAFQSLIDVGDDRLMAPDNMPETIQELCREGGQPVPETRGAIVRCALEGLAAKYRKTLRTIDGLVGRPSEILHVIGGGTQNKLLNQMTADACNVTVVTGPVEATVLGNLGVQAMAVGALGSLKDVRQVIADSSELDTYTPQNTEAWDKFLGE